MSIYRRNKLWAISRLQESNLIADLRTFKKGEKPGRVSWSTAWLTLIVFVFLLLPQVSWASGIAGNRYFPVTLAVDHPFVCDELSFIGNYIQESDQRTSEISVTYSKRITPNLGIDLRDAYRILKSNGGKTENGFSNFEVGAKYQFLVNDQHETLLSIGIDTELGKTGNKSVGANSFSTISPKFFFGKGLGDLPEPAKYLRPLAVTGAIGPNFPTRSRNTTTNVDPDTGQMLKDIERNPATFTWGLAAQYSLQYLQTYVKDVGLGTPFNRMIFLAEFPLETSLNRGSAGRTTGFVNPGVVWCGEFIQLGIEAQIPINNQTRGHVGVLAIMNLFIDDIFPKSLGRPIFP